MKNNPDKPSKSRKKRFQFSTHSLAESKNTMDLLGSDYLPPPPQIVSEPDEFELFIRKVEAFSAQQFLEKAEQATISTQSEESIQKSVVVYQELISETLADLLAKQAKIKQAIKMYQKLSAQQPNKADYFNHKIDIIRQNNKS